MKTRGSIAAILAESPPRSEGERLDSDFAGNEGDKEKRPGSDRSQLPSPSGGERCGKSSELRDRDKVIGWETGKICDIE